MKRILALLLALFLLLSCASAEEEEFSVSNHNEEAFVELLTALVRAYEKPSEEDGETIDSLLQDILDISENDYEIAEAITSHWRKVYLDPDYPLRMYHSGEETASELEETGLENSDAHAFVVLGYKLYNGEMTKELKGRCRAAAAAARSYPGAILVCSGGATGENNPQRHTEAGEMRKYLVKNCGIDKSRIFIDEKARDTVENAVNTFEILREQGIRTITIVTSSYHQKWGQAIYNAMNALYRQRFDYSVEIVENYCYEKKPKDSFKKDDRWAASQLAAVLNLPGKLTKSLPRP